MYLHIGQHKTGSSAIQAHLSLNAAAFEKSGIGYPFLEGDKTSLSGFCSGNILHKMKTRSVKDGLPLNLTEISEKYFDTTVRKELSATRQKVDFMLRNTFIKCL